MIDYPKTIEEAKKYRYGSWVGNPKGTPYKEGRCAYEVWSAFISYQCTRNNGHGPEGLYCKQHAKMLKERS